MGENSLPDALIVRILGFLTDSCNSWSARLVCQAAHAAFKQHTTVPAKNPDQKNVNNCWRADLGLVSWEMPLRACIYLCCDRSAACTAYLPRRLHLAATLSAGDLRSVSWLVSQGCPQDSSFYRAAAAAGSLPVLQALRSSVPTGQWTATTCSAAARAGHVDVLDWLRSQDPPCPWDAGTCRAAACSGHLHVLRWVRSQDPPCPWGQGSAEAAAARGDLQVGGYADSCSVYILLVLWKLGMRMRVCVVELMVHVCCVSVRVYGLCPAHRCAHRRTQTTNTYRHTAECHRTQTTNMDRHTWMCKLAHRAGCI